MQINSDRIPRRIDLRRARRCAGIARVLAVLLWLAAMRPPMAGPDAGESTEKQLDAADQVFLAPFASVSFLRAVEIESIRRRILLEKATAVYRPKKSTLIWATKDNGVDIDWRAAHAYCEQLELAGFDDWRLPGLEELETLLEPMARKEFSTPDEVALSACCPWSTLRKDDRAAWSFNFKFRKPFTGSMTHTFELRALCVRDALPADEWVPEAPEF